MKRARLAPVATASVVALLVSAPVAAQRRAPVDIAPCVDIESALERLDCYDQLARTATRPPAEAARTVDDVPTAQRAPPPAVVAAPAAPPPTATTIEGEPPPAEILSTIVSLRELLPGRFEVELANGQVWRQTRSDRYRLRVGHEARIYRAQETSRFFRLTVAELRGFVQVEQVR